MLEAVIFDMDGLLADTEWPDFVAWQELFAAHGDELTLEQWVGEVGVWGATTIKARFRALRGTEEGEAALFDGRRARFREQVALLSPLPGVERLIATLEAAGIPCGVASSSDREWVAFVLGGLGLQDRLGAVVTGDDVAARKPAPDLYLEAARRLGVRPSRCVAIEDSAVGASAAVAAGMRCVAVPNLLTRFHNLDHAHARVSSLEEVELSFLRALLAS